jgi:hypothetical protein
MNVRNLIKKIAIPIALSALVVSTSSLVWRTLHSKPVKPLSIEPASRFVMAEKNQQQMYRISRHLFPCQSQPASSSWTVTGSISFLNELIRRYKGMIIHDDTGVSIDAFRYIEE